MSDGLDVFWSLLGIASVIVALGLARALLDAVVLIDRIIARDSPKPTPPPSKYPWGDPPE